MLLRELSLELPTLVMFDLDGTLVDSVPDLAAAVDTMLQALGRPAAGEALVRDWVGNGAAVLVQRALAQATDAEAAGAEIADEPEALALFLNAYEAHTARHSCLYPGVLECLQGLQQLGITMAVVTNKPERFVAPLLDALGIGTYIDLIVGGDTLAQKKPHPQPLLHCLAQFQTPAAQALMVGDSKHDIHAARSAQVAVAAVSYGYNHGEPVADAKPDVVIDNLMALLAPRHDLAARQLAGI